MSLRFAAVLFAFFNLGLIFYKKAVWSVFVLVYGLFGILPARDIRG